MSAQPQPNQQRQKSAPDLSPISPRTIRAPAPGTTSNPPPLPQASHVPAASADQYTTPHTPLSQPLSTGEIPIPATPFAAPYLPRLFSHFSTLTPSLPLPLPLDRHFEHLACSYTSHPHAPAPTMEQLKQHAQALCLLITTLSIHTDTMSSQNSPGHPSSVLDFLPHLLEPYHSCNPEEKTPLDSLRSTVAMDVDVYEHWPTGPETRLVGCPTLPEHQDGESLPRFMGHANQILEIIDFILEREGGLLAALPARGEMRELAEGSLLGQWLGYTQDLVMRVAELEREVAGLRELCGGAMVVPRVVCAGDRKGKGKGKGKANGDRIGQTETEEQEQEQETEKEKYILAGLTPSLWTRLQSELSTSEQLSITREQRAYRRGFTAQSLRSSFSSLPDTHPANGIEHRPSDARDLDLEQRDEHWVPDNVVAWIECSSRIYKCQGDGERLFVVPAWNVRPGVEKVKKVEETPLVVSVPVRMVGERYGVEGPRGGGDDGQGGGAGKAIDPYGNPVAREGEGGSRSTRGGAKTRPGAGRGGRGGGQTRGNGAVGQASTAMRRMPTPFPGPDDGLYDVDAEDGYNVFGNLQNAGGELRREARPAQDLSDHYKKKFEEQKRQCEVLRDIHEQLRLKVEQFERS